MPSQIAEQVRQKPNISDDELVETDGEPLDSEWHRMEMNLLIDMTRCHFGGREDYYAGGNMFIYFSEEQARNRDFRGPDYFFVKGVNRKPMRRYWAVWNENWRFPDVIIELLSESTAQEDLTTKKDVYEQTFKTAEYFCYDPDTQELIGWRLIDGRYQTIDPDENGRLWSEQLAMWLGVWNGVFQTYDDTWLRFFDSDGNVIYFEGEAEREQAQAEAKRAEAEAKRAEAEAKRANAETKRADTESQRAEKERQRAETAEAELARLRELLAQQKADPNVEK